MPKVFILLLLKKIESLPFPHPISINLFDFLSLFNTKSENNELEKEYFEFRNSYSNI